MIIYGTLISLEKKTQIRLIRKLSLNMNFQIKRFYTKSSQYNVLCNTFIFVNDRHIFSGKYAKFVYIFVEAFCIYPFVDFKISVA